MGTDAFLTSTPKPNTVLTLPTSITATSLSQAEAVLFYIFNTNNNTIREHAPNGRLPYGDQCRSETILLE